MLFMITTLAALAAPTQDERTLFVQVLDASGDTNAQATVIVDDKRISVNDNGLAAIPVDGGEHELVVTHPDHYPHAEAVDVPTHDTFVVVNQKPRITTEQARITFAPSSADLTVEAKRSLNNLATEMAVSDVGYLRAEGFADPTGDPTDNLLLSQARADAVEQYLEDLGLDPTRVVSDEYGELIRPSVADAMTDAERRVVVIHTSR